MARCFARGNVSVTKSEDNSCVRVHKIKPERIKPGFPAIVNNVKPFVFCIRQTLFSFSRNRQFGRIKQSQTLQQQDSVTLKPGVHTFSNNLGATSNL